MSKLVNTQLDFGGVGTIIGLPDGAVPQSPATVAQLNAAIEGLAWKDNVVVSTQGNITLAGMAAVVDGITLSINDRFLVRAQTAALENGIYIFNGGGTTPTRSLDANTMNEIKNAVVSVDSGTSAGATYRQTSVTGVMGTDPINWTSFGGSAPASTTVSGSVTIATQTEVDTGTDTLKVVTPATLKSAASTLKRYQQTFGDGAATQYTITHNLNTRDAIAVVRQAATPWAEVICDIEAASVNSLTIRFASAPAINAMRISVLA